MTPRRQSTRRQRRWRLYGHLIHVLLTAFLLAIFLGGAQMAEDLTGVTFWQGLILFLATWLAAMQASDWTVSIRLILGGYDDDE